MVFGSGGLSKGCRPKLRWLDKPCPDAPLFNKMVRFWELGSRGVLRFLEMGLAVADCIGRMLEGRGVLSEKSHVEDSISM